MHAIEVTEPKLVDLRNPLLDELLPVDRKAREYLCRSGNLPRGVAVQIGKRWFLNVPELKKFIAAGGAGLKGQAA